MHTCSSVTDYTVQEDTGSRHYGIFLKKGLEISFNLIFKAKTNLIVVVE
jgi:hypothetical protein